MIKKTLILLLLVPLVLLIGCDNNDTRLTTNQINVVEIKMKEIDMIDISVNDVDVITADVEKIILRSVHVDKIEFIELEVISLNDGFIQLVKNNFENYYGEPIDWNQVLTDIAVGGVVIGITVVLSTVGGGIGTYFGIVVANELTAAVIAIGAAIDATIEGVKEYNAGGDFNSILARMIEGVADGFKWGAILAPVTGGLSVLKLSKAAKAISKIPGLDSITKNYSDDILRYFDDIAGFAKKVTPEVSVDVAYKELIENSSTKITKEIFEQIYKNLDSVFDIVKKFDAFNVADDALNAIRKQFIKNNNVPEELVEQTMKNLLNGSIKKVDDVGFDIMSKSTEFLEYFGSKTSKELLEDMMMSVVDEQTVNIVLDAIKSTTKYKLEEISKDMSIDAFKTLMDNSLFTSLIEHRFNKGVLNTLLGQLDLYKAFLGNSIAISDSQISSVIHSLIDGTIKNASDLSGALATNSVRNAAAIGTALKKLGLSTANKQFIASIASESIVKNSDSIIRKIAYNFMSKAAENGIDISKLDADMLYDIFNRRLSSTQIIIEFGQEALDDIISIGIKLETVYATLSKNLVDISHITPAIISDILLNALNKAEIISKYGQEVYDEILINNQMIMNFYKYFPTSNSDLIKSLFRDFLQNSSISTDIIEQILKGESLSRMSLTNEQIIQYGNLIANYYRTINDKQYLNFVLELAEIRSQIPKAVLDQLVADGLMPERFVVKGLEIMLEDPKLASIYGVVPAVNGFPILDQYAIARVDLTGLLTGANSSMDDIRLANLMVFGTTQNLSGFTWHHVEDGRTLILVPTELHSAIDHTGGATYLRRGIFE